MRHEIDGTNNNLPHKNEKFKEFFDITKNPLFENTLIKLLDIVHIEEIEKIDITKKDRTNDEYKIIYEYVYLPYEYYIKKQINKTEENNINQGYIEIAQTTTSDHLEKVLSSIEDTDIQQTIESPTRTNAQEINEVLDNKTKIAKSINYTLYTQDDGKITIVSKGKPLKKINGYVISSILLEKVIKDIHILRIKTTSGILLFYHFEKEEVIGPENIGLVEGTVLKDIDDNHIIKIKLLDNQYAYMILENGKIVGNFFNRINGYTTNERGMVNGLSVMLKNGSTGFYSLKQKTIKYTK